MSTGILMGNAQNLQVLQVSITPAAVSAVTSPEQTFTFNGLLTTDMILNVSPPSNVNGVSVCYGRVSADNTLAIKFVNPTAGSVTPAAGIYKFTVLRPEGGAARTYFND